MDKKLASYGDLKFLIFYRGILESFLQGKTRVLKILREILESFLQLKTRV